MAALSVDWSIGTARALGNLIENCVATVVVAARESDLDRVRAQAVLANPGVNQTGLGVVSEVDGVTQGCEERHPHHAGQV